MTEESTPKEIAKLANAMRADLGITMPLADDASKATGALFESFRNVVRSGCSADRGVVEVCARTTIPDNVGFALEDDAARKKTEELLLYEIACAHAETVVATPKPAGSTFFSRPSPKSSGFAMGDLVREATGNAFFRRVAWTGKMQLVLMKLRDGESIGMESHGEDQFFLVAMGTVRVACDGLDALLLEGQYAMVPAGSRHDLKAVDGVAHLVTIYAPAHHAAGRTDEVKGGSAKGDAGVKLTLDEYVFDDDGESDEALSEMEGMSSAGSGEDEGVADKTESEFEFSDDDLDEDEDEDERDDGRVAERFRTESTKVKKD
jgi:mannose-6-phosphate isomerase-like protein (cupin superfamily)